MVSKDLKKVEAAIKDSAKAFRIFSKFDFIDKYRVFHLSSQPEVDFINQLIPFIQYSFKTSMTEA